MSEKLPSNKSETPTEQPPEGESGKKIEGLPKPGGITPEAKQQIAKESEKKQEDEFTVAKKHLEEFYSPDKASIDVGLNIGKESEILIDKSIEKKPEKTPEQIKKEEERAEEEEKKQKAERLKDVLSDPEIMKRRIGELAEAVKEVTGEDLIKKGKELAKNNLEQRGMKIVKISEVEPKLLAKEIENIKNERYSEAVLICQASLLKLPEKQRKEWGEENGKINSSKFMAKLDAKMAQLGISREVFSQIAKEKYDFLNIEHRGFWGRIWYGSAIKLPSLDGRPPLEISEKKFKVWLDAKNAEVKDPMQPGSAQSEAKKRVDKKIIDGRNRLLRERQACIRDIIKKTVEEYKKQQEEAELQRKNEEEAEQKREETEKMKKKPVKKPTPKKPKGKGK